MRGETLPEKLKGIVDKTFGAVTSVLCLHSFKLNRDTPVV